MVLVMVQQATPIVVEMVNKPSRPVGVADILLQAIGLTGVVLIGAALFGLLFGGALIWFKFKRPGARDSEPAVSDYGFRLSSPQSPTTNP